MSNIFGPFILGALAAAAVLLWPVPEHKNQEREKKEYQEFLINNHCTLLSYQHARWGTLSRTTYSCDGVLHEFIGK